MQKHNEWMSNRGYEQHLNILTKIYAKPYYASSKTSKVNTQTYLSPRSMPINDSHKN